jgi:SAM-dependent methyltransferase
MAAIETWPPNAALATKRLHPLGVMVIATRDEPPLPFADEAFDLVTTRHPISVWWNEILRVLRPGGTYFAQHIGPATVGELVEYFIGPQPEKWAEFRPDAFRAQVEAAGLQLVDLRAERLRCEFFDVGAVIYFLRKVIWTVPGLHRGALSRAAARTARAHQSRGALRRALDAGPRRRAQTRLTFAAQYVQRVL